MQSQLVWQIMHKRTVSIKRTVCKNCHMTLFRDDSKMDMTAMAKNYNFHSFMNFDKSY